MIRGKHQFLGGFLLIIVILVDAAAELLLKDMFESRKLRELPSDKCPVCSKQYKHYASLKQHIIKNHPETFIVEGENVEESDSVNSHTQQLLKVLLMKRCLDYAIKTANGEVVSLLMKHMMLYFHKFGYRNYALACFEHVAQYGLFLSERTRELIQQECFVNNRGGPDNNLAMDLDLEHSNRFFKDHFQLKTNLPSQPVLDRLSLSQDKLEKVLARFNKEFHIHRHSPLRGMNTEIYKKDVKTLQQHLSPRHIFQHEPGRTLRSRKLLEASHDPLLLVDMYELKQWLKNSLQKSCYQRFLK